MDLGSGPGQTHGLDGPGAGPMVGTPRDGHDALHLQGEFDTGLCWCYFNGVGELALCVFTSGTACGTKGVPERIVWRFGIFPSASDAVLYGSTHRRSDVDGSILRPTADEMESRECTRYMVVGHLPIIVVLELPRVMWWVSGRFSSGCCRSDTNIAVNNDAVHGLRAAPEPDAALRQAVEVSQFVALVQ